MAIGFSCSACGERFSVGAEHAGRRTKCRVCGWGITVPMEAAWETDDATHSPDFLPPPIPSPRRNRVLWPWLVALAAGIAGCVVVTLFVAHVAGQRRLEAERLAEKAYLQRVATSPTRADIEAWSRVVEALVDRDIQSRFRATATIEGARISTMTVRLAPADERKIPWLWEVNATVAVRFRPQPEIPAGFATAYLWKGLMQCVPGGPVGECWRDVTDPGEGTRNHYHYKISEWTGGFRVRVASEWLAFFERLEKNTRNRRDFSDYDRKKLLTAEKQRLARSFKITAEELEEILEATD